PPLPPPGRVVPCRLASAPNEETLVKSSRNARHTADVPSLLRTLTGCYLRIDNPPSTLTPHQAGSPRRIQRPIQAGRGYVEGQVEGARRDGRGLYVAVRHHPPQKSGGRLPDRQRDHRCRAGRLRRRGVTNAGIETSKPSYRRTARRTTLRTLALA